MWSFPVDNADDTMFFSVPVVTAKRIFVAGCVIPTSPGTSPACWLASTPKRASPFGRSPKSATEIPCLKPFYSSPALTADGKYLVIGGGLHEDTIACSPAMLRCRHRSKLHWAVKTTLHIESSPAIFGDIAVVGCGAIEGSDGKAIGDPGHVLAVRISDGKELWRQPVNDPESSPAIDSNGIVYIGSGFNGNAIVALRIGSDEELAARRNSSASSGGRPWISR